VCIWARILAFDASCRTDLVKDNAYVYFITHLCGTDVQPEQRVRPHSKTATLHKSHSPKKPKWIKQHGSCPLNLLVTSSLGSYVLTLFSLLV
jgi:hypothetical protein